MQTEAVRKRPTFSANVKSLPAQFAAQMFRRSGRSGTHGTRIQKPAI